MNHLFIEFKLHESLLTETIDITSLLVNYPELKEPKNSGFLLDSLVEDYIKRHRLIMANPVKFYILGDQNTFIIFITELDINAGGFTYLDYHQIFISSNSSDVVFIHELGHSLDLDHTFEEDVDKNGFFPIEQGTTNSFMDYGKIRKEFFLYQWKKAYLNNKLKNR
jgi:hypothetical protein